MSDVKENCEASECQCCCCCSTESNNCGDLADLLRQLADALDPNAIK